MFALFRTATNGRSRVRGRSRQHQNHDRDGADVEDADAPHDAPDSDGDGAFRILGFGCGDGDDLDPTEGECHDEKSCGNAGQSIGHEAALPEQIARTDRVGIGEDAEHQQDTDDQEADDDGDFDCGEPELELTEVADFRQVHHGENTTKTRATTIAGSTAPSHSRSPKPR